MSVKTVGQPVHLSQLDALRGIAALLVFAYHDIAVYGWDYMTPDQSFLRSFRSTPGIFYRLISPFALGWTGVELFFVLSGFCIHLGFARTKTALNLREFFSRRFWRIYPAYLLVLFAVEGGKCNIHWIRWWLEKRTIVLHILMIHNTTKSTFADIDGPFWTLAYEWQFYCLYPLFLVARRWLGMGRLLGVASVVGLCAFLLPIGSPYYFNSVALGSQLYILWCLGALLAERFVAGKPALVNPMIAAIVALPLIVVGTRFNFLISGFFAASILDWSIRRPMGRFGRSMVPLGMISYSFYLLHFPIMEAFERFLVVANRPGRSFVSIFAIALPTTILAAWISYRVVEMPCIRLGGYLRKRGLVTRTVPASPLQSTS